MKTLAALTFLSFALFTPAQETAVVPTVDSVGLFKNGLCVVQASFEAKAAGVFRWEEPPRSVHGTFFVESDAAVTVQSTLRKVEEAPRVEPPTGVLQADLAGCDVHLIVGGGKGAAAAHITGKVWTMPTPEPEAKSWNTQYAPNLQTGYNWNARQDKSASSSAVPTTGGFLVLEKDAGVVARERLSYQYIALSTIDQLEVLTPPVLRRPPRHKSVMLFSVDKPGPVRLSWLTKGATWVPSYFVDIADPKNLRVRQTAVIKNELMALKDARLDLISGFPNVPFAHVDSPLSQSTSLASFFQQIAARPGSAGGVLGNQMMQNSVAYNRASEAVELPDMKEAGASSEDLHFESLGKRTLAAGDALSLNVADGSAEYERVVEWTMSDTRDAHGQYTAGGGGRRDDSAHENSQPWDALLFKNPLKFPMTTASATIREGGKFRGQSQSNWTNPGQRACLRITRALSVQADHSETEEAGKREQEVWMGGNRYYRTAVKGEATMRNFRATPVTMLVRAQFSGELLAAEGEPADTLRREGDFSVNARHELEWKVVLPAAGEKKLAYSYSVLVRN